MSKDSPTLPFTRREIELLTRPMPVIDLEKLKPTPIRLKKLPSIDRLVREATKPCIRDNREFCMNTARMVLLTVAPREVARVLREAVNAGVQYEVALAYIAHALKAGCTVVASLEDVGDQPCIVYNGELSINTKPLVEGRFTLNEASEFGTIVQPGPSPSLLERLTSLLRGRRP